MHNKKYILYSICLLLFIDAVGGGMVLPILPELFKSEKYGLIISTQYFSMEILYGFSLVLFPLSSIFGMPLMGQMADKYGKCRIILYGLMGTICVDLLCVFGILIHSFWIFLLSRFLMGFLAGTYSAAIALISDISDSDEERISNFKLPTFASLVGLLLGPSFSILVSNKSAINPLIVPFFIVFCIGVLNLFIFWLSFTSIKTSVYALNTFSSTKITTDTNTNIKLQSVYKTYNYWFLTSAIATIISSLFYTFSKNKIRPLFMSYLCFQFALGLYEQSLSLFFVNMFSYTSRAIGLLMVVAAGTTIVSMYALQPFVVLYCGYMMQMKIGLIAGAILFIVYATYGEFAAIYSLQKYEYISFTVLFMIHLFIPFITMGFTNLFASSVGSDEQGKVMGGAGQISSIAIIISGLFMGKLLIFNYATLLVISSIFFTLSCMLLIKFCRSAC